MKGKQISQFTPKLGSLYRRVRAEQSIPEPTTWGSGPVVIAGADPEGPAAMPPKRQCFLYETIVFGNYSHERDNNDPKVQLWIRPLVTLKI